MQLAAAVALFSCAIGAVRDLGGFWKYEYMKSVNFLKWNGEEWNFVQKNVTVKGCLKYEILHFFLEMKYDKVSFKNDVFPKFSAVENTWNNLPYKPTSWDYLTFLGWAFSGAVHESVDHPRDLCARILEIPQQAGLQLRARSLDDFRPVPRNIDFLVPF